jgi:hypothetical protein
MFFPVLGGSFHEVKEVDRKPMIIEIFNCELQSVEEGEQLICFWTTNT